MIADQYVTESKSHSISLIFVGIFEIKCPNLRSHNTRGVAKNLLRGKEGVWGRQSPVRSRGRAPVGVSEAKPQKPETCSISSYDGGTCYATAHNDERNAVLHTIYVAVKSR